MEIRYTVLSFALLFSACAATAPKVPNRAAVVMKISDREAYICMGIGEVRPGDRVGLYKNECVRPSPNSKNPGQPVCRRTKVGEGLVTKALNEHYSTIQVDPGIQFEEGTTVEKL